MKVARTGARRAARHSAHLDVVGRFDARAVTKGIDVALRLGGLFRRTRLFVAKQLLDIANTAATH